MKENTVSLAVVGAGAAGLVTAIWAARTARSSHAPIEVLLLDSRPSVGAKILMSGGTRCNVTNREVKPSDFQGGPRHFIKHVLEAFTPQATLRFFEEIGVKLVLEPGGKYFPATHSAKTVLEALLNEAERAGVVLKKGVRITEIKKENGFFHLKSSDTAYTVSARKVVLTTGGLSYPGTGSDGTGYAIAKSLGHNMVSTFPALTPLLTRDADWKSLSGISVHAALSLFQKGKKVCEYRDSLLFTHFGFSGPAALNISRHFAASAKGENPEIYAGFLPTNSEESFQAELRNAQRKSPKKLVKNFLIETFSLPARLAETFLNKTTLSRPSLERLSNENRRKLTQLLFHFPLEVSGVFGYKKAEVTAGGVDLKEIEVKTMESKLVSGLYFAGEILDADGRIGGFNFQWAWSTGAVAGRSAAQSLTT